MNETDKNAKRYVFCDFDGTITSRESLEGVFKIFAADIDTSGEFFKVTSDFEGGSELVAKVDVMNLFDAKQRIVIGDGATDINMAREGTLVFARDSLAYFLGQMKISYRQWSDFYDVQKALEAIWQQ